MTPQYVIHIGQQAIVLMLMISAPMLLAGLTIGLAVSILQVHEVTLTFIPKILAVSLALMIALPWMLQKMLEFMTMLIRQIPAVAN